jgi:HAD superfamily hydrolase (TIGR01549 family)
VKASARLPRPDVIFFDLYGTVFKWSRSPGEVIATTLSHGGHPMSSAEVNRKWKEVQAGLPLHDEYPGESEWQYWRHYDGALLQALGIPPSKELLVAIRAQFEQDVTLGLQEDAIPTLAGLRQAGARLGVVSNATFGMTRDFNRLEIGPFFESVVFSQAINARKPDPHIFLIALSKFGVAPSRAWMVGDDPGDDVAGGQGAGLVPILIDRSGQHENVPCTRVPDLREVVALYAASEP